MGDYKTAEYENGIALLSLSDTLTWGTQSVSLSDNPYSEGLVINDLNIRRLLLRTLMTTPFLVATVDKRYDVVRQVHVNLASAVAKAVTRLGMRGRDFDVEPLTMAEYFHLVREVATYWQGQLGDDATPDAVAGMMVMDEVVGRRYKFCSDATQALLLSNYSSMFTAGMPLATVAYYAHVTHQRLGGSPELYRSKVSRRNSIWPSYDQVLDRAVTFQKLEELQLVNISLEIVKKFVAEGALPELEVPKW